MKISVYNDRSTDKSKEILLRWKEHYTKKQIPFVYSENQESIGGCGFAKNRCVLQSHGKYLCFQDADDVMYPERIQKQVSVLEKDPYAIVGTHFEYIFYNITKKM